MDFKGQTALITGASTGIGAEFADQIAARGANLVLVARSDDTLQSVGRRIRAAYGVRVDVLPTDLTQPGAGEDLAVRVAGLGLTVDVLVNNAGFATHGDLVDADPRRMQNQVQLNCAAVVDLTTRFLPGMVRRRGGAVINVASTAAFQPVAHMAVYAASKAFVLSFTEAVWSEVKPHGVNVLALCPGSTETPFFDVVGAEEASFGKRRSPQQVVTTALHGLADGRPSIVDGKANAFLATTQRFLPHRTVLGIAERAVRPRTSATT
jgi:short-subunit dehydrogenase